VLAGFDCGNEELNVFLQRFALNNQNAGSATTYIICTDDKRAMGYYSLATGSVERAKAPLRIIKGLAKHPVPVMLLARLAVDEADQSRGLGRVLLKDALSRTAKIAELVGVRALLVHAKDEVAGNWYKKFDFEPSPTDPNHLLLLMKDLQKHIK